MSTVPKGTGVHRRKRTSNRQLSRRVALAQAQTKMPPTWAAGVSVDSGLKMPCAASATFGCLYPPLFIFSMS